MTKFARLIAVSLVGFQGLSAVSARAEAAGEGTPTPVVYSAPESAAPVPVAPPPTSTTTASMPRLSISLDNAPLQDVIRMFARIVPQANIVSGTNLTGTVTVNLQEAEWEPALRMILESSGYTLLEKSPGIYTVVPRSAVTAEPLSAETFFLNYSTEEDIMPIAIAIASKGSSATATFYRAGNALVVYDTPSRMKMYRELVKKLDKPRNQVMIEAKFVEMNDEAIKDIGVNWDVLQGYTVSLSPLFALTNSLLRTKQDVNSSYNATLANDQNQRSRVESGIADTSTKETLDSVLGPSLLETTSAGQSTTLTDTRTITRAAESAVLQGKNLASYKDGKAEYVPSMVEEKAQMRSAILSAEQFALTLSALKQNSGVEILSNPKVVVASGQTAKIHVGRNEPNIVAVPQGDTGDRYAYQLDAQTKFIEIGVKLEVTPVLNADSNNITVRISPELSRKLADKTVGEAGTAFPITQIRKIDTEFSLESGKTVAIGGLTETTDKEVVKKIPVLGDIPLIGRYLFRHTSMQKVQDEVVIFVTVSSAQPSTLTASSGVPEGGRLIYRHLGDKEMENSARKPESKTEDGSKPRSRTFTGQK